MTRRDFFKSSLTSSAAMAAGVSLYGRTVRAVPVHIPHTAVARRMAPNVWFPPEPSSETFRALALAAMDAARAAGADFADVRIGIQRNISVPQPPFGPSASLFVGYGVRARVQGTWGFQYGSLLAPDAIVATARNAVSGAKRYAAANRRLSRRSNTRATAQQDFRAVTELAAAPVVTGEWHGPCQIDPFLVPLDDYYRIIGSIAEIKAPIHQNHTEYCAALGWQAETRIFASTTGTLITQHFVRGGPRFDGGATLPESPTDSVLIDLPGLEPTSAGFESALRPEWTDYLLTGIEESVRLREIPFRRFQDVGRFPIVFEGAAFANLMGLTVNLALDGERSLGIEADASGTSFLTPVDDILSVPTPSFSPLLTVTCDRALPSTAAVQWDDEGVVPDAYTLIQQGHVTDYHTTRETASLLANWYAKRGAPLRSHGSTVAVTPASLPMCGGGHVTIAAAASRTTVNDLTRDMTHGFVIRAGNTTSEPGLTAGTLGSTMAMEVERGRIVARTNIPIQFVTKPLLKNNLVALGDATTARTIMVLTSKGIPWRAISQPVTAPAALCKDVDVFSWAYTP